MPDAIVTLDGAALTTARTYDFPDTDGTFVLEGAITGSGLTIATNRLAGRTTGGTGALEEIAVGSGLTFSSGSLSANVTSVAGRTGAVTLTDADISGLGTLATLNSVDLTANVTGILPSANGGTANGFTKFSGPASSEKTFALPNASSTILTDNAAVTVAQGGSGATTLTGYIIGNSTSPFTASASIPNTDITGLGTMSTQNATSVNIDGGTIDGTTVGASSASSGAFTTVTASGTITANGNLLQFGSGSTLGPYVQHTAAALDIKGGSTGGVRILNNAGSSANAVFPDAGGLNIAGSASVVGLGVTGSADTGLRLRYSGLSGSTQFGIASEPEFSSSATTQGRGISARVRTAATSFTQLNAMTFYAENASVGSGSAITNLTGYYCANLTGGSQNIAFLSDVSSGTNKWNVYINGTAANYFNGQVSIGDLTLGSAKLAVKHASGGVISTLFANNDYVLGSAGTSLQINTGAATGDTYYRMQVFNAGATAAGHLTMQTSGGNVSIGTTDSSVARLYVLQNHATQPAISARQDGAASIQDWRNSSGLPVGAMTSTGLNSCAIGATTASTGAFTSLSASGAIVHSGIISPTQLTANTNDWNPTGLSTCSVIRASTDTSRNLTGIVAQTGGRFITLANVGAQDLVLIHDATSTAANRFLCPGSANFTLNANDCIDIWYDGTSSRWRVKAF